jgi:hypothetical protein
MLRVCWAFVAGLFAVVPLIAGEPGTLTRYEARLDLLSAVPHAPLLQEQPAGPSKKSVGLAVVYSLLLPGMGELYAEGFSSGKYFLIAEGALWLGSAAVEIHGNDLRDGARSYAVARAGVSVSGKDDDFFVDIGNFMTVEEYNEKRLRDREVERLYDAAAGYSWRWDSDASRTAYKDQRISSENMYNNRKFIGIAVLVNHIVSAINAARCAIAHNRAQQDVLGDLQLSSRVLGGAVRPHGVAVTIAHSF